MGKFYTSLTLSLAFLFCGQAQAEKFYYIEDFDNPEAFADNQDAPDGWFSEGSYPFHRMTASAAGYTAQSGDYVFGTTGSPNYGRDEVFSTKGIELKGGVACTLRFYYLAPGGNPSSVRNNTLHVAAGSSQDYTAMTEVGKTATVVSSWKQYEFTFTPDEDGTYYFGFKLEAALGMSGYVLLDDIEVEGEAPDAAPVEGQEVSTLASFYGSNITATDSYKYIGEAVVTYAGNGLVFVEDGTAAIRIALPEGETSYKVGDKVTAFEGTVETDEYGVLTLTPAEGKTGETLSEDNAVATPSVTLAELLASPADYVSELVKVSGLSFKDTEDGDVFEEGTAYTVTDGASESGFSLFSGSDLADTAIPTADFDLVALVVPGETLTLMPRSAADITEAQVPVVHETQPLPYLQSFDNTDGDYDGTSYLPIGWTATGTVPFITAYDSDLSAATGTYYMVTSESSTVRDEVAYTPFFDLKAGTTYSISFQLSMPGNNEGSTPVTTTLTLTAGSDQTAEAQTETLLTSGATSEGWTQKETSFTPTTDGQYCFAFSLSSEYAYAGLVAIDDVLITAPGLVLRPTADFTYEGWFDIMNGKMVTFSDAPVKMINTSKYGTSYEWEAIGATPETSTEENPSFLFDVEGDYTVKLTATNATGSRTTYKTISVERFGGWSAKEGLKTYNNGEKIASGYTDVPTFPTDSTYDFISGPNHYYRRYAERFTLPEDVNMVLSSISTWQVAYQRMTAYTSEERNHPFTIALYGETDGRLDESKCFGKKVSTVADEWGSQGIGLENSRQWGFSLDENPITVNGTFYLALEFDASMPIDSDDPNIVRTFAALSTIKHASGATTLYAQPTAGPEGFTPDGGWYRADQISSEASGYGLNLILWGELYDDEHTGIVAVGADGSIVFDTCLKDATLHVSGTTAGESVDIYDLAGRLVSTCKANAQSTAISVDALPHGTYVVKCAAGARKFAK